MYLWYYGATKKNKTCIPLLRKDFSRGVVKNVQEFAKKSRKRAFQAKRTHSYKKGFEEKSYLDQGTASNWHDWRAWRTERRRKREIRLEIRQPLVKGTQLCAKECVLYCIVTRTVFKDSKQGEASPFYSRMIIQMTCMKTEIGERGTSIEIYIPGCTR